MQRTVNGAISHFDGVFPLFTLPFAIAHDGGSPMLWQRACDLGDEYRNEEEEEVVSSLPVPLALTSYTFL